METSVHRAIRAVLFSWLLATFIVPQGTAQSPSVSQESLLLMLDKTPAMGDPNARVIIVEFGDYQCPYCGKHATQVLPQIIEEYVKTGKVRYFFKDTPVEAIHPQAFKAAEAALCAGAQGKYWEMHDRLFKNQQSLSLDGLGAQATALVLDIATFQQCLDQGTYASQIRNSIQDAVKSGARGTPTFIVAKLNLEVSGQRGLAVLSGGQTLVKFREVLDQMLAPQEAEGKHQ